MVTGPLGLWEFTLFDKSKVKKKLRVTQQFLEQIYETNKKHPKIEWQGYIYADTDGNLSLSDIVTGGTRSVIAMPKGFNYFGHIHKHPGTGERLNFSLDDEIDMLREYVEKGSNIFCLTSDYGRVLKCIVMKNRSAIEKSKFNKAKVLLNKINLSYPNVIGYIGELTYLFKCFVDMDSSFVHKLSDGNMAPYALESVDMEGLFGSPPPLTDAMIIESIKKLSKERYCEFIYLHEIILDLVITKGYYKEEIKEYMEEHYDDLVMKGVKSQTLNHHEAVLAIRGS